MSEKQTKRFLQIMVEMVRSAYKTAGLDPLMAASSIRKLQIIAKESSNL